MMKCASFRGGEDPYRATQSIPRHCTQCGNSLGGDFKFCPKCGTQITPHRKPGNQCPCGTVFGPDEKFCSACGKQRPKVSSA